MSPCADSSPNLGRLRGQTLVGRGIRLSFCLGISLTRVPNGSEYKLRYRDDNCNARYAGPLAVEGSGFMTVPHLMASPLGVKSGITRIKTGDVG